MSSQILTAIAVLFGSSVPMLHSVARNAYMALAPLYTKRNPHIMRITANCNQWSRINPELVKSGFSCQSG